VVEPERKRVVIGAALVLGIVALTGCATTASTSGNGVAEASALDTDDDATTTTSSQPPTTVAPTTVAPTTVAPTTDAPTTDGPTTDAPTTVAPTTVAPTTVAPTTTVAPNVIAVEMVNPALQAVGARSGGETARIQQRLFELGFWLSAADGDYGLTTRQAVMAFQKYMGFDADGKVDQLTADTLTLTTQRPMARANSGTLVEVDKAKQLLYFVIDGSTHWILNTSTGNGEAYTEADKNTPGEMISGVSLTPSGLHQVNRQRPDGWWEGDLGKIYRPKYFVGGVAVHGSNSIPNYPASHGCVRVSVPAMDWIWDSGVMPMRSPVWVHDGV
jgi:peptidoglycan hydrolase-like protein with peptidoglycan-binding domain